MLCSILSLRTIMYAFRFKNLMKRSKHQKQHLRHFSRNCANVFCAPEKTAWSEMLDTTVTMMDEVPHLPLRLWSKYSRTIRINCTAPRMREPKAKEPVWKLKTQRINNFWQKTSFQTIISTVPFRKHTVMPCWRKRTVDMEGCHLVFSKPSNMRRRRRRVCTAPVQWKSSPATERQTGYRSETPGCFCGTSSLLHKRQSYTVIPGML